MSDMGVPLRQVAHQIPGTSLVLGPDVAVSHITHDSRQTREGALFVAIRGEVHDGHGFVASAIEQGAAALLVDEPQQVDVPQIVVPDTREAMAWAARAVFGKPDESLAIAGVTGTNGKTTVTHMLEAIFEAAGTAVGVIGTLGARMGGTPIPTARTTPEATDLQRILAEIRDEGVGIVLMEVSSHAVQLHRSDAIRFAVVGFTNLSQDHLDFHGDMESYFRAKRQIFDRDVADCGVINIDDLYGERLRSETKLELTTVSITGDADLRAENVLGTSDGTRFDVITSDDIYSVELPLVGDFNVSNALIAFAMAQELGVEGVTIAKGLSRVHPISGRMEVVRHDGPFSLVVDYAHTPDAIAAVLGSVGALAAGRIISIIGAGGDRDAEKRAMMGATAVRLSDLTIVTTDNPRTEDPSEIADEIRRGALAQPGANVETILDRRSAIVRGVAVAQAGDIVVVLGKGHEQGQEIGSVVLPFDDREEAREALRLQGWDPK
jgi:UDP-N-acetylmuramoyl-L-alanyl-D-glutamate--2,6-diaminopimelate ligase